MKAKHKMEKKCEDLFNFKMMLAERKPLMWKGISEVGTENTGHTVFAINACYR